MVVRGKISVEQDKITTIRRFLNGKRLIEIGQQLVRNPLSSDDFWELV